MDHRSGELAQRSHFILMEKLGVGFLQFPGALVDHLFEPPPVFLLLQLALGKIVADFQKPGNLAALFPQRVDADLHIMGLSVRTGTGTNRLGRLAIANHRVQRTSALGAVAGLVGLVVHLEAFFAHHFVFLVAHLSQKGLIGIHDLLIRRDDQNQVLDAVKDGFNLPGPLLEQPFPGFECLPEQFEGLMRQDPQMVGFGIQDLTQQIRIWVEQNEQVHLVVRLVQFPVVRNGTQPPASGQHHSRRLAVRIGHGNDSRMDLVLKKTHRSHLQNLFAV